MEGKKGFPLSGRASTYASLIRLHRSEEMFAIWPGGGAFSRPLQLRECRREVGVEEPAMFQVRRQEITPFGKQGDVDPPDTGKRGKERDRP